MKKEESPSQSTAEFNAAEAWSRFERAVDGAAKHGPIKKAPTPPKRQRTGANKRRK